MTTALLSIILLLFIAELLYFKVAAHYNIIDKPNHRSSHTKITIRGGGIIFALAMLLYPAFFGLQYAYFLAGMFIISLISFLDDLDPISSKIRIGFHLIAVGLLFCQLDAFHLPFYFVLTALVISIGIINAINFMDGINGITGAYAFVTLISLLYINGQVIEFISSSLIYTALGAILVFNFFNFRSRARCFAGDVGSVGIAFVLIFLIAELILVSGNLGYLLLLVIYGLDTISTIIFRLIRRERIFEAHRSHYYQYLANERKIPQLYVSSGYALVQLLVNALIVYYFIKASILLMLFLLVSTAVFVGIRFYMEGKNRLLKATA
ncbi:glycosyltransferase family 4 protein [Pedobacter sp. MC2016-14]|uniref:MraY family glycosyltransferase n=1 Tax=Pedobacter sp. MC2016-14 TaxID=2897327 RepID=UPI001E42A164|nr:glycosyltransferase family 4 protein [Pedobacter sp. MC2016-14]MCD0486883.1 glycosyltransferase family 4 protein [Pedobacter sp. MC2016-14]